MNDDRGIASAELIFSFSYHNNYFHIKQLACVHHTVTLHMYMQICKFVNNAMRSSLIAYLITYLSTAVFSCGVAPPTTHGQCSGFGTTFGSTVTYECD